MSAGGKAEKTFHARIIAAAPLFAGAAEDDIAELARCGRGCAIARGKAVAALKGRQDEIYIIESGAAAFLYRDGVSTRPILISLVGPGGVVGMVSALNEPPAKPPASIAHANIPSASDAPVLAEWRALSNITAVAVPTADFFRVVRRSPDLAHACLAALAAEARQVASRYAASVEHPLESRLAFLLEQLGAIVAGNNWEPTANLGRLQQTQLAEMLGVSREHVNRTLIMWEKSGLVFQSKSGDLIIENRKRLAQLSGSRRPPTAPGSDNEWLWEIERHIDLGLNAAAYDLASEGARRSPKDDRFKYSAALAMARMGALTEALSLVESFKLSKNAANEDIASIGPRLRRDLAFSTPGRIDADQLLIAANGYEKVYKALKTTYPGVNAATTYAMAGDLGHARKLAGDVAKLAAAALDEIDDDEPSYWSRTTLGECLLVDGDHSGAAAQFAAARRAPDAAPGRIATTRKQLRRLEAPLGIDAQWIDEALPQGRVLFFCGPLSHHSEGNEAALTRLQSNFEDLLSRFDFVAAIGALAAGADIIIAEALIAAGVALHVHLPLPPTEFLAASVEPFGGDWRERYIACIEGAQTVDWMRRAPPGRSTYRLGARAAMGRTIRLAEDLATTPFGYFALQKGRTATNSISHENAAIWKELGLEHETILSQWRTQTPPRENAECDLCLAALVIQGEVDLKALAAAHPSARIAMRDRALAILAFDMPEGAFAAARTALAAPSGAAARYWLDAGVGGAKARPDEFARSLITASCRPQTAPGKVYASEAFTFAATATACAKPVFEYIGYTPTEEKLAPCPLYLTHL